MRFGIQISTDAFCELRGSVKTFKSNEILGLATTDKTLFCTVDKL